ncbi:DUF3450 domain-containing protein [Burkholderia pseudomallei]|uniref:hypothetical protein n=1 Tax=Burkholderia pseudomallei TaxID=28450 RepID=UPI0005E50E01|nr:hypothetical protein [Burkholderia pseudomallei]CFT46364.1 gp38 [Burkholderia pseudomallei]
MTTTDNSRADALTDAQIIDLIYECDIPPYCELAAIDFARRLLLAVSQPAAAPIPEDCDVRNILLDVVPGEDGEGQEVYARNVADVESLLSEMGEKLDAAKQPAPSPVDERAAFDSEVGNIIADAATRGIAWMAFKVGARYARAASANETGAEVAQQLSAEIRELKVKLGSYEREREDQTRYLAAQSEEIAALKYQLAQADARVGLTATVIQKCIDSCAAEYLEDVTGHPEDAAYCQGITDCIDALNRLKTADWSAILAAHSGQSEPETATVARIEQLRKALFESRDAMRVMSNWAKKPDPAGHSWAVRMVDRANAALNGEPEPRAEVTEEQPSLTNPLTPYGMLVRALRIVSGTTLMDMADALLTTPAKLSAMEFDREPVTLEFAFEVAAYFDAIGVLHTASALRAAAARTGGQ